MDKDYKKWFRRKFNKVTGMFLLYQVLFQVLISLLILLFYQLLPHQENFLDGGLWYLITAAACFGIFLFWKGAYFFKHKVFQTKARMRFGTFMEFFSYFILAQVVFSYLYVFIEMFFNRFGLSLSASLDAATSGSYTVSMFLYSALVAPVVEELIFRGAILKTLEPYGKWFALLASSLLFGLMHGNFAQIPFAFAVGMILGYVSIEYSIWYSILLHIANNFLLGEVISRILDLLPAVLGNLLNVIIMYGLAAAGIVFLIRRTDHIRIYIKDNSEHSKQMLYLLFTTVCGVLAVIACLYSASMGVTKL